jgi:hypothetical protein
MRTAKAISILLVAASLAAAQALTSSDGDGVPDIWKANGYLDVTLYGQTARIDLAALGVRKGTKAVIVWVDWMAAPDHMGCLYLILQRSGPEPPNLPAGVPDTPNLLTPYLKPRFSVA